MRNLLVGCLLIVAMIVAAAPGYAGDCRKTGSVCVDSTPCKNISGQQVCLSQFGLSCWEYEDTYTCIKPNAVNYCQPFINAQPQCWQNNAQCSQWDSVFGTGCMKYTQTWRCNDPNLPAPSNTVTLNDTYTLVSSNYNAAPCQSLDTNPNCAIAESKCVSTTPPSLPPNISPSQVAPDGCYQKQNTYACMTGAADSSECDGYASNPNCTFQSSTCDPDPAYRVNGQCTFTTKTYKCMSAPSKTNTVNDCSVQTFCLDGNCYDKSYENDSDFAKAITAMEAAREAGTYMDPNSLQIFKGVREGCAMGYLGLKNCCKTSGGASTNNSVVLNLGFQAVNAAGGAAANAGSKYLYDFMYPNGGAWQESGFEAMLGGSNPNTLFEPTNFTPSMSFYGLTASMGTMPATGILGGPIIGLGSAGGFTFYFDPYSFAISLAVQVIMDMMSCEPSEQALGMHRGANLCHYVGSYCSNEIPIIGTCIETTKSYCCFNSRLARIINEQGRPQLPKGWGSGESPDCSGFTADQLARLDFSTMDLSEFYADVMATIQLPDASAMVGQTQNTIQNKVQQFYSQ